MPKHSKGENVFSKYMGKKLLCFQVYGYYKIIIILLKNTQKIFTLCEQYYLCITIFPHMTNRWQLTSSLQFPPFFYYNELLFAMFFLYTEILLITKNF